MSFHSFLKDLRLLSSEITREANKRAGRRCLNAAEEGAWVCLTTNPPWWARWQYLGEGGTVREIQNDTVSHSTEGAGGGESVQIWERRETRGPDTAPCDRHPGPGVRVLSWHNSLDVRSECAAQELMEKGLCTPVQAVERQSTVPNGRSVWAEDIAAGHCRKGGGLRSPGRWALHVQASHRG